MQVCVCQMGDRDKLECDCELVGRVENSRGGGGEGGDARSGHCA